MLGVASEEDAASRAALSSARGSPVMTKRRQGWMLEFEGAWDARVRASRRVERGTGVGLNQREAWRVWTALVRDMVGSRAALGWVEVVGLGGVVVVVDAVVVIFARGLCC